MSENGRKEFLLVTERKRRNLSQAQLGRLTGIDPSTMSKIESRKVFCYSGWRRRLSGVLGIPGEDLFREVGNGVEPTEAVES